MNDEEKKNNAPEIENEPDKIEEVDYVKIVTKRKNRNKIFGIIALVCLASIFGGSAIGLGFGIGSGLINNFFKLNSSNKNFSFSISNDEEKSEPSPVSTANNQDTVSIINEVSKSVVAVNTVSTDTSDIFFGLPIHQSGSGSGIIFHQDDAKVYIATNYHVINGASSVNVTIENSEAITAKPVGKNFQSDLAVICIDKNDLKSKGIENVSIAKFGDSDNIRVGEKIIAIGNALGEGNTVTSGIISAKDKKINVEGKELSVIQIDASINPGNSGGALINTGGEVIGITTAKYAKFTVEGMAYSIASNDVKPVIEDIMNQPNKPYLGITGINLTQEIADNYGLPTIGVFVNSVVENSNAQKYGLRRADIITKFNDKTIYTIEELSRALNQYKIGDTIKLHIIREGKGIDLEMKLEEYHDSRF